MSEGQRGSKTNPSPVSPKGERLKPSSFQDLLWKPNTPSDRKEVKFIPFPFGEGQTDMPINHANQGEVSPSPLTTSSPARLKLTSSTYASNATYAIIRT